MGGKKVTPIYVKLYKTTAFAPSSVFSSFSARINYLVFHLSYKLGARVHDITAHIWVKTTPQNVPPEIWHVTKLTSGDLTRDKTHLRRSDTCQNSPPETWHVTKLNLWKPDTWQNSPLDTWHMTNLSYGGPDTWQNHLCWLNAWQNSTYGGLTSNKISPLKTWHVIKTSLWRPDTWPPDPSSPPQRNQGHDLNTWQKTHLRRLGTWLPGQLRPRRNQGEGNDLNAWQNSPPETWHVTSRSSPTSNGRRSWPDVWQNSPP